MTIQTIAVCGAGTMGSGIAQVAATAGFTTILYELNETVLEKAKSSIAANLQTAVEKGKLSAADKEATLGRITFTSQLQDCIADIVIEAIVEKVEVKVNLFNQLAAINAPHTIIASNTSSLSITAIAKGVKGPERIAGLHFFNPAFLMKLVEVVKGEQTDDAVITTLVDFTKRLGKTPVVCKDAPGFIVNRVARPYYIEALRLAEEGQVDLATIDQLLESKGFKMGPFKLMDLIGNDINYAVSCSVYDQLNQPERLKPSYIQKEKVEKGELGKKTGKGYYKYTPNP
ncbi:3-hydroxyacyl-CoA dehydrogenase NAD-binding domain-containing protein [Flavisolibacter tropicus]|uniref:3-hydroxybutyryl-CoA dehydrogenase n=1 Tax=Flavisolibacter tropicus TaxID=1492898 RepID=A0A172TY27_9BACT|nr:3-hydroxyacyl-CoA dehydrogenase NAD-binding domain-containing protein [Flavisolibacter tropicus]ANE51999.1 3-hydroxybutyryl-CoA dehydrogenase [Flavisolibacter tropicus]